MPATAAGSQTVTYTTTSIRAAASPVKSAACGPAGRIP